MTALICQIPLQFEQSELRQRLKGKPAFADGLWKFIQQQIKRPYRLFDFFLPRQQQAQIVTRRRRGIFWRPGSDEVVDGFSRGVPVGSVRNGLPDFLPEQCLPAVELRPIERLRRWQRIPPGRKNQAAGLINLKGKCGVCPRPR